MTGHITNHPTNQPRSVQWEHTHITGNPQDIPQLAWKRYKQAQAATKKIIMHAFNDYHFLELQDDNGDIVRYTTIELFGHLMDQYVQPGRRGGTSHSTAKDP